MNYIVYKTLNLVNDRFYVGVHGTENPNIFDGYLGTGVLITKAIKKYGKKNFTRVTLIDCEDDAEEAYSIEEMLVKTNKEDSRSYNVMRGGRGCFNPNRNVKNPHSLSQVRSNNAIGLKKYNDGINEYHFRSSDPFDNALTNIEFRDFLLSDTQLSAGRIPMIIVNARDVRGVRKYNDGTNEFNFKPLDRNDIELSNIQFEKFIADNDHFYKGTLLKGKRSTTSPMLGGRKYNDGKTGFLFKSSDMNNRELTEIEFDVFIKSNPTFKSGKMPNRIK